jgi:hypothetical protein
MRTYEGVEASLLIFLTSTLDGDECSVSRSGLLYPRRKKSLLISYEPVWTLWKRRKIALAVNQNLSRLSGIVSLYRLRFTCCIQDPYLIK